MNSVILNKDSKIFINHIEFCNFKDNLNLNIVENEYIKASDFLNLFNNDTYSTYAINGKKVDIKLSELKFDKILNNLNRFDCCFEIKNDNTIPSMSENDLKNPIGLSYLKDYKWPKDKIIFSIQYGDKREKVVDFKNNVDIDDVFEAPKKQGKGKIIDAFVYVLYSLKDKFVKDSQKCDFPKDKTGIKDIIIKTKSEEIKLENLHDKKYEILFLELVDKAVKDDTLKYVKIILSTGEELDFKDNSENKYKCCNK